MESVKNSLQSFEDAVSGGKHVIVNQKGEWHIPGKFKRFIRWIFCSESKRLQTIADVFAKEMDSLRTQQISIQEGQTAQTTLDQYSRFKKTAEALIESGCESPALKRRVIAMEYRIGAVNGGKDKQNFADTPLFTRLKEKAAKWKERQGCFKKNEKALTQADKEKLKELCRYQACANLLMEDPVSFSSFLKWSIRDGNAVDVFVEFPSIQIKVSGAALSKRVGVTGSKVFGMHTDKKTGLKDVKLAFVKDDGDTVKVSLLDENNTVSFNEKFQLTIGEVFRVFSDKKRDIAGNLDMFEKGITNWNIVEIARYNGEKLEQVDTMQQSWWEKLPVYKTISSEEARNRYGDHMDGTNWTVSAKCAVDKDVFDFEGNHGFMEVVIPVNGEYRIYPFGKFVEKFPSGGLSKFLFLFQTVQGRINYLDQNVYHGQRQVWEYPIPLNPNQGERLMGSIGRDIRGDEGANDKFNFKNFNCSQWVQSTITNLLEIDDITVPNLYQIPLSNAKPQNFLAPFLKFLIWIMGGNTYHPLKLARNIQDPNFERLSIRAVDTKALGSNDDVFLETPSNLVPESIAVSA